MTKIKAKELLYKYQAGTCTEKERALLESWYLQFKDGDVDLNDEELELIKEYSWQNVVNPYRQRKNMFSWIKYAAAIFVFASFSIGIFFYLKRDSTGEHIIETVVQKDLKPGGNKAILTLSDGSIVSLDELSNGIIAQVDGMDISKTEDGQIVYKIINKATSGDEKEILRYNQIATPRGGQYQIVLPDGTKVWLNAASSLKYPERFNNEGRHVELIGEGYFEVKSQLLANGSRVPFTVSTPTQNIEVLGTHFNVNSYEDEEDVKTTLLEGVVRVSANSNEGGDFEKGDGVVLKPNQQSTFDGRKLKVIKVDPEESIAWKNGYFSFEHADIETVMRQLSRWYDVDIVYEGNKTSETFTGKVYRNMNISKVLEVLTFAQVNFKIEGEKMTLFP